MKHLAKILSLGAALVASPLAHATLISIGLQESGATCTGTVQSGVCTVATDSGNGAVAFVGSYGTFNFNTITAQGAPALSQGSLSTGSIQTSSTTAGTITIYITETGLTSPTGLSSALSSFTSNLFSGAAISVVESTLYSSSNALYGGSQMSTATFTGIGTATGTSAAVNLSSPYSETVKYVVTVGAGTSNVNDTINITPIAATPEPSSLIMLGTGLMSAAGMLVRRRKIA